MVPELSIVKGSWVGEQGEGVCGAFHVSLAFLSGFFFPPYALSTIFLPCLHTCTGACSPTGCSVDSVTTAPLLTACGSRRGGGGGTAHAQPAWPRDTVIGTCQAAAAHFRKSTGAFTILLLAGMVDPPAVGHLVSVLTPTWL